MLLRCCFIHINTIILRCILCLVYLCLCLDLGLFISYLCDIFLIFSLIVVDHIISLKQTRLFFAHFLEYLLHYFWMIPLMKNANNFQIAKFSLAFLIKKCDFGFHCAKHQNFTWFPGARISWKRRVSAEFRAIRSKLCRNCAFSQNFHTRKLNEISVFDTSFYRVDYMYGKLEDLLHQSNPLAWNCNQFRKPRSFLIFSVYSLWKGRFA